LIKKLLFFIKILFLYQLSISICLADLQKNIINKLTATQTLTFDFKQKISDNEENGICFIKYPLLMKCNYNNLKEKIIISNGKTVAIIKKKYKKIYLYPIKSTPLFFILKKEKIIDLIRKTSPTKIDSELIEFMFMDVVNKKKTNVVKIFFDKNSLNLKGWETLDAYSNKVTFQIENLKINNQILDNFFKIPQEKDL
tara:strand:+ start:317 stop:907 length:591 start_codon:yes stop_codon:yes gene_type:complete